MAYDFSKYLEVNTNKEEEKETSAAAIFGDAPKPYFRGFKSELRNYLRTDFPELYNSLFIKTLNDKTTDWFNSFDKDYIQELLYSKGFIWESAVNVEYKNCDIVEYKVPYTVNNCLLTKIVKDELTKVLHKEID